MAGYTRNDTTNQIADGNVINAAPLDGEFNAIESAFNVSTGHTHDGSTTGDGGPVSKLGPSQETVQSASTLATTTDITVATNKFIQFRDSGLKIQSSADGKLDIDADTELEMVAPTVDIDASTAVTIDTATMTVTGSANVTGDLDVDNINIDGNAITSTDTNGNISLTPNGTGSVVIDGLSHPQADGSAGQFLKTDGSGQLSFDTVITDLSNDTTPQLGGNLDLNSNDITGTGNIDNTGTVTTDGLTVAGNTSISGGTIKLDGSHPTGTENTAFGEDALDSITSGASSNVAIGFDALEANTDTDHNTAVGHSALKAFNNAGGLGFNTAVGADAMEATTTGTANTAVGYHAMGNHTTGDENVAVGYAVLNDTAFTGSDNTAVGTGAGIALETGDKNTFLGYGAGSEITTGSKNVIIGSYDGDTTGVGQMPLDIRTASNHIILSDGDGTVRMVIDNNGRVGIGVTGDNDQLHNDGLTGACLNLKSNSTPMVIQNQQASGVNYQKQIKFYSSIGEEVGSIRSTNSATQYASSSDYRLKENVESMTGAISRVKQLAPKRFSWIKDNLDSANLDGFLAHEAQTVVPDAVDGTHNEVDDDGNPVMQGIDHSKLVPLLTGALQEAIAKIETLETKVAALEAGN